MKKEAIKKRLEEIRKAIKAEIISTDEIIELQSLVKHIDKNDVELLEWADVEEFEQQFYVDIPQEHKEEWLNTGTFDTREEAIKFAQENFGADENGMVSLISQS